MSRLESEFVGLFNVVLGAPAGTSFPMLVQLQDINGDLSTIQTVNVGISTVPLPAAWLLFSSGIFGLRLLRRPTGVAR